MIRLTNADADRLAALLDQAEILLREHGGDHRRRADAMRYVGDRRLAEYHATHAERVLAVAEQVRDASQHARDREPWTAPASRRPALRRAG